MKKESVLNEVLMTYGWAILVVLVVITTLAYFGVFNPTRNAEPIFISYSYNTENGNYGTSSSIILIEHFNMTDIEENIAALRGIHNVAILYYQKMSQDDYKSSVGDSP